LRDESPTTYADMRDQFENDRQDEDQTFSEWFSENTDSLEHHFDDWHTEHDAASLAKLPMVRFLASFHNKSGTTLLQDYMNEKGKDGIIYDDAETGAVTMVATDADQIKSAK
jgi:hypothetical protein